MDGPAAGRPSHNTQQEDTEYQEHKKNNNMTVAIHLHTTLLSLSLGLPLPRRPAALTLRVAARLSMKRQASNDATTTCEETLVVLIRGLDDTVLPLVVGWCDVK